MGLAECLFWANGERRRELVNCFLEKRLLGLGLGGVLIANGRGKSEFPYTSQNAGRNIRTAWVVADVFREQFFAPVRSCEARFDRYLRN